MTRAAAVPVALALLLVTVAGCGSSGTSAATAPTPAATDSPSPTPEADTPTPQANSSATATATSSASPSASATAGEFDEGRQAAFITKVDVAAKTVTIDVVQYFTGTAAAKAAAEDGSPDVPPPNDYWVRNSSKALRTEKVAADATITVNTLAGNETGDSTKDITVTLAKLASYGSLKDLVFWVVIDHGTVTSIKQQFQP